MAKKIIVLDKIKNKWNVLFWLDVPVGRQSMYVKPSSLDSAGNPVLYSSQWKGASTIENEALRAGQVVEVLRDFELAAGTTLPQAQLEMEQVHAELQAELSAYNPWLKYGTYWDGTTWTTGGLT